MDESRHQRSPHEVEATSSGVEVTPDDSADGQIRYLQQRIDERLQEANKAEPEEPVKDHPLTLEQTKEVLGATRIVDGGLSAAFNEFQWRHDKEQEERLEEWENTGVEMRDATPEEQRAAVIEEALKLGLTVVNGPPAVGSAPVYADVLGSTPVYAAPSDVPYEPRVGTVTGANLVLPGSVKDLPNREHTAQQLKEMLAAQMGVPIQYLQEALDVIEAQQGELFQPDLEVEPHPDMPDRVNRTKSTVNLPGGVLMDTRKFEKWVLESFVPLQDQLSNVEQVTNRLADEVYELTRRNAEIERVAHRLRYQIERLEEENGKLKADLSTTKSRLSKTFQRLQALEVREPKAKVQ